MSKIHDLQSQRFGRLVVVCSAKKRTKWNRVIWLCRCDCGNQIEVIGNSLLAGRTKSCGCLRKEEVNFGLNFKHGDARHGNITLLYMVWESIKDRCLNPNNSSYKSYGGQEITICKRWKDNYLVFKIWAMANGYRKGLTIDRIDNKGNYEPSNCQWITQSENSKKSNKLRKRSKNGKHQKTL